MAISLISYPQDHQPAYNKIEWVFNSGNVNTCDFVYIGDLYINGSFAIRLKAFPDATNKYGYFNIERIIQDYLSFDFQPGIVDFKKNTNGIVSYYLEIRERYNSSSDCTGSTTLSSVLYTTNVYYAWNGCLQYHDYPTYNQTKYTLTAITSKFLSNVPNRVKLGLDDEFNLGFLQVEGNQAKTLVIKTYSSSGLIGTYTLTNPFYSISPTPDTDELYISIPTGPNNINGITFLMSPAVTQPIINSNVKYYTVQILDNGSNTISQIKRFDVNLKCSKFNRYSFHWLNTLGQFDSYSFTLKSFINTSIGRTSYTKNLHTDYSVGDRGDSVISIDAKGSYVVNSDWVSEDVAAWLKELFTSPEVYVNETKIKDYTTMVTGGAYVGGFAQLTIDIGLEIPANSEFNYSVSGGSVIGMPDSGTGTILSYDPDTGVITTDIVATTNVGSLITGILRYFVKTVKLIPIVITSNSFEEKMSVNVKNIQYSIEFKPSYSENIQSL